MNPGKDRERRIEQMLIDEFRQDGFTVDNRGGDWFGYVPASDDGEGLRDFVGVNLTRMAASIDARLP